MLYNSAVEPEHPDIEYLNRWRLIGFLLAVGTAFGSGLACGLFWCWVLRQ